jgi:hypothetical protein
MPHTWRVNALPQRQMLAALRNDVAAQRLKQRGTESGAHHIGRHPRETLPTNLKDRPQEYVDGIEPAT